MLYADDARVVSQSPKQPREMMVLIVVVCEAFSLTVSEAKTEIMCLRTNGMLESTARFSVEAAGQVYNQTNEFVYLGVNGNHNVNLSIEVNRRIRNGWCNFMKYILQLYDRPSAPLELKIRMLRAEVLETMLYGCVRWSPRACHNDTLRRAHHSFLIRCIGWRKNNRTDHPISYLDTLMKTGSDAPRRLCAGGGSCSRDLWRAWGIQDCRSAWCSKNWWETQAALGARKNSGWGVSWTTSELLV